MVVAGFSYLPLAIKIYEKNRNRIGYSIVSCGTSAGTKHQIGT
jgi:hypothetical protein